MASLQEVIVTLEDGVRLIKINRPKRKNAYNSEVYKVLTDTLNSDANNDNVVVTIITGQGEYYSSGFDIKSAGAETTGIPHTTLINSLITAFMKYPKLLIAIINGPAIGIGVTTAALCDIIYASDRATFEVPFVKLGLCAEGCSSYTLPRLLGRSKASEMLLLGKKITAQEAYQFGLVARVINHNELDQLYQELKKFGKLPVGSIKINKKLIMANYEKAFDDANERELKQIAKCILSDEFSEAIMRFMSKSSKL